MGGSRSDLAWFLLKCHHFNALTMEIFVLGRKNWQTSISTSFWDSLLGRSLVTSIYNAWIIASHASLKMLQHVSFPLFENEPVLSAHVKAWKASSAAVFIEPKGRTTGCSLILRWFLPLPVTNTVF